MHPTTSASLKGTPKNPTISSPSSVPLSNFKSGQLLCLTPNCRGGLILQKPFYADFVGPGGAVGSSFDIQCKSVYVVGAVELYAPATYEERALAFKTRMLYSERIQTVLAVQPPLQRAWFVINQLCRWIGAEETQTIPPELIAQLGAVLPKTGAIALARLSSATSNRDLEERPKSVNLSPQAVLEQL